jgi:hypothetical protein
MTTSTAPLQDRTHAPGLKMLRTGVAISAVMAAGDIALTIPYMLNSPMPFEIGIATIAIDLLTLAGVVAAWRATAWGVWLVVISRFLSLLPIVPLFFVGDVAPPEALPLGIVGGVITLVAIALIVVGLPRRRADR